MARGVGVERFPVSLPRGPRRRWGSTATARRRTDESTITSTVTTTKRSAKPQTSKQRTASKLYNLEMDVVELTGEIERLRVHHSLLHTRALFTHRDVDGSAFQQAQQYFHIFRHGLRGDDPTPPAFLASIADEQLQLGVTDFGRDMLVEQWRRYTAYFAIRKYEFHSVRVLATERDSQACVVRGEGVFHGAFTRQALEIAFPSVLLDPWLTHELLDKPMVTPVAFVLYFEARGRFVRHDGEVDLFEPLRRTLGDYCRAAAIMERAVVAEEGMLDAPDEEYDGPVPQEVDDQEEGERDEEEAWWRRGRGAQVEPDCGLDYERGEYSVIV